MTLCVGDVVTVGRAVLANPEGSRAVVVEIYQRGRLADGGATGCMLLFENGAADGFSEGDLELFKVEHIGHAPRVSGYHFTSVMALDTDFRRGHFESVWTKTELVG